MQLGEAMRCALCRGRYSRYLFSFPLVVLETEKRYVSSASVLLCRFLCLFDRELCRVYAVCHDEAIA